MKIFVDINNGDEAKIYYARYERELYEFAHSTNIPLTEKDIDETDGNKDLCANLRKYASPSRRVDVNDLEKYYFYIPTGKVRERTDWEEYVGEEW